MYVYHHLGRQEFQIKSWVRLGLFKYSEEESAYGLLVNFRLFLKVVFSSSQFLEQLAQLCLRLPPASFHWASLSLRMPFYKDLVLSAHNSPYALLLNSLHDSTIVSFPKKGVL